MPLGEMFALHSDAADFLTESLSTSPTTFRGHEGLNGARPRNFVAPYTKAKPGIVPSLNCSTT